MPTDKLLLSASSLHILPLLFSILWGYALVILFSGRNLRLDFGLVLPMSALIGLGATVWTTFLSLLMFGSYQPKIILFLNLLLAALTWALAVHNHKKGIAAFVLPRFKWPYMIFIPVWTIIGAGIYFIATTHPFGEWDAWAIWNMKLRFILYGGEHWKDIFTELHWHTHPDYPLYLPVLNAWVYTWAGEPFYTGPKVVTTFFTILSGLLLFGCLKRFVPLWVAFIVGTLCMAHPYAVFLGTSQYADIILACYLLGAMAMGTLALREKSIEAFGVFGLILGIMPFIKNEGLVMAGLLLFLTSCFIMTHRILFTGLKRKIFASGAFGFFLAFIPSLILKAFLAPANDDILPDLNWISVKMTNWDRLIVIFEAYKFEFLGKPWVYAWPFVTILLLLGIHRLFRKECRVMTMFFLLYFFVVVAIYLFTQRHVDLKWWLDFSLRRILLTQFPAVLFLAFYAHWRKKDNIQYDKTDISQTA